MQTPEESDVELTIDDARDFLFTSLRACERYAKTLQKLVDDLNKKKNQDPWLEAVHLECQKGLGFHQNQVSEWERFSGKMEAYISLIRKDADELALDELTINKVDENGNPIAKKESKFVHPELAKFKLEKQARILGYGGVPALPGMALPRAPRENILRATATPAAVEIMYSKAENKEARELANVMQFKTKKKEEEKADWQKETHERRRALARAGAEVDEEAVARTTTISNSAAAPIASELSQLLRQRQSEVDEADAAAKAAEKAAPRDELVTATAELAGKLQRRQQTLAAEAEAERLAKEEAEASSPPPVTWSNPGVAFGSELASALQRRGRASGEGGTPGPSPSPSAVPASRTPAPPPGAGANSELAAILNRRKSAMKD